MFLFYLLLRERNDLMTFSKKIIVEKTDFKLDLAKSSVFFF